MSQDFQLNHLHNRFMSNNQTTTWKPCLAGYYNALQSRIYKMLLL